MPNIAGTTGQLSARWSSRLLLSGFLILAAISVNWPSWRLYYNRDPLSAESQSRGAEFSRASSLLDVSEASLVISTAIDESGRIVRTASRVLLLSSERLRARAERLYRQELEWPNDAKALSVDLVDRGQALEYPKKIFYEQALLRLLVLLGERGRLPEVWRSEWRRSQVFPQLAVVGFAYELSDAPAGGMPSIDLYLDRWSMHRVEIRTLLRQGQDSAAQARHLEALVEYRRPLLQLLVARFVLAAVVICALMFIVYEVTYLSRRRSTTPDEWNDQKWLLPCFLGTWLTLHTIWIVTFLMPDLLWEELGGWPSYPISLVAGGIVASRFGVRAAHLKRLLTPDRPLPIAFQAGACCLAIAMADLCLMSFLELLPQGHPLGLRLSGVLGPQWDLDMNWPTAGAVALVLYEELCYRGLLFSGLRARLGPALAAVVSCIVFAALHPPIGHAVSAAWGGLVYAGLYHRTGSLAACVVAHLFYNTLVAG